MATYTACYTKIEAGYMGQLLEWPEVITEGDSLEECRAMLIDAAREMTRAFFILKNFLSSVTEKSSNIDNLIKVSFLSSGISFKNLYKNVVKNDFFPFFTSISSSSLLVIFMP